MDQPHVPFMANGVKVFFPFEPYKEQRDYCNQVIDAIKRRENAILESPTGTGKTLSLLTSSLAWQQGTSEPSRMIFYLSRTHIQLSQAAKEMKKTAYARVPSVVLASRQHMCLNDEVRNKDPGSINRACRNAITKNSCQYYTKFEDKLKANLTWEKVHDIEDLQKFGRTTQCCPYFASKKIAETQAALVFMPYNYLLDLSVRKSTQLKLENSVVIIDEGHNFESSLKDSASGQFTMNSLKLLQESCEKLPAKLNEAMMQEMHGLSRHGYDPDKVRRKGVQIIDEFKPTKSNGKQSSATKEENKPNPMEELAELLTNDKVQQVNMCAQMLTKCKDLLRTNKGCYIDTKCDIEIVIATLRQAGVDFGTSDTIIKTLEGMATFWSIVNVVNERVVAGYMTAITSLSHFISLIYPPGTMSRASFEAHLEKLRMHYSAYLIVETERDKILESSNKLINWTMHMWCLNPGIGLKRVIDDACMLGPRSIIITSGTLAPIDPLARDMEKKFAIQKEFGHLITHKQLQITILNQSPNGFPLETTFEKTKNPKCQTAIGETLASLLTILPYGTLVFFPSYRLMNIVLAHCEMKPFWTKLKRATNIFKENNKTFSDDLMTYKKKVDQNQRAVFIGVCRGKLSEGTNLQGNHCRSVIVIGLPYPNKGDPQIIETLAYKARKGARFDQTWYTDQMKRALGQAIGRVIRSKDDFGMVFLCDPRFTMFKLSMSKWIQEYYPYEKTNDYRKVGDDIKEFFARYNIDISALSLANATGAHSTGAFEFDNRARSSSHQNSKKDVPVNPRVTQSQCSAPNSTTGNSSTSQVKSPPAKTLAERQAAMMASYKVDRATYAKIKMENLKKESQEEPALKRAKTTADVINSLYAQGPSDESASSGTSADKLRIESKLKREPAHQEQSQHNDQNRQEDQSHQEDQDEQQDQNQQQQAQSLSGPDPSRKKTTKKPKNLLKKQEVAPKKQAGPDDKCYICKNDLDRPYIINCPCKRVGCHSCLKGLNNRACGDCGTVLKLKNFKQKMFNLFQKRDA